MPLVDHHFSALTAETRRGRYDGDRMQNLPYFLFAHKNLLCAGSFSESSPVNSTIRPLGLPEFQSTS